MKIKIEYNYDPRYTAPYFATTTYENKHYAECDEKSFNNAKIKLLETLKKKMLFLIPEPEEVEI